MINILHNIKNNTEKPQDRNLSGVNYISNDILNGVMNNNFDRVEKICRKFAAKAIPDTKKLCQECYREDKHDEHCCANCWEHCTSRGSGRHGEYDSDY